MRILALTTVFALMATSAFAQQRPLVTQDPETIGAGRVLVEGGIEYDRDAIYPVSGLQGNLLRMPMLGVSIGLSSIAELQIDRVSHDHLTITQRRPGPLSGLMTVSGTTTGDFDDIIVGTKIRVASEGTRRPAFGIRFA